MVYKNRFKVAAAVAIITWCSTNRKTDFLKGKAIDFKHLFRVAPSTKTVYTATTIVYKTNNKVQSVM